jgi:hypothetical protein
MYKTIFSAIKDSLHLYQNHVIALISITLPFLILIEVFEAYYINSYLREIFEINQLLPLFLPYVIFKPIYSIAIIFYISSVLSNQTLSISQAWYLSLKFWPIYFILSLLTGILVATGILFYYLPGAILFVLLSFSEFYLLLEKQTPFAAIKSSFQNTMKYFWLLSGGFVIFTVIIFSSYSMLETLLNITDPEIDTELIMEMLNAKSASESQAISSGKMIIQFPDFSILKALLSIVFNLVFIIFTIFSFRVYQFTKEDKTTAETET